MSYTNEGQIHEDIGNLPDKFLQCRTLGHAWVIQYMGPVQFSDDDDLIERARRAELAPDGVRLLRCSRCRCERIDLCLVGYGRREYQYRLVGRQYRYPKHYQLHGVQKHRDWLHEEMFDRMRSGMRKGK